jgi:hypothetical protein
VSSGTIQGMITDESGGVLAGVTLTLTSPQLQIPQIVKLSDASGFYKFVDLPAGTYRLQAELPGFSTAIRNGLSLTVGFVATVNFGLTVGTVSESVTVSGQSPIVDITSTSASVAFAKETLDAVPRGLDVQDIIQMAPGVTLPTPDVGGSTMATRQNISSYGMEAQPKLQVEGMNVAMGADENSPIYFNDNTLQEVQIKTSGNDAEVSTPGISMVAIMKSGGNQFHGAYSYAFESPHLQSGNLSAALRAQGLSDTSPLKSFRAYSGDLGGRIVKDKLWFYGAFSRQEKSQGLAGFASGPGPDGRYLTADDPLAYFGTSLSQYSAKFSYQISNNNRITYAWQRGTKAQPANGGGRLVPLESTRDYRNPTAIEKVELQSSITARVLLNAVVGYAGYVTDYDAARSYATADRPARQDIETGLSTGSHPLHQGKTRDRYQSEDSISFFPSGAFLGRHELKTGVMLYFDQSSDGYLNNLACNCILYTDRINGVSGTPSRIRFYNTPVVPQDRENTYAWYVKDAWRPTRSVSAGSASTRICRRRATTARATRPRCSRRARFRTSTFRRLAGSRRAPASPGLWAASRCSGQRSVNTTTCSATPTAIPTARTRRPTRSSGGTTSTATCCTSPAKRTSISTGPTSSASRRRRTASSIRTSRNRRPGKRRRASSAS